MKILEISFKNIFSYGEDIKTIDYRSDNGKLVLLKGKSGSGKSAILSLPVLLVYGKPLGTNKSSIANRINKNGYIKGTIENNGHTYVIERYFTPNKLFIYKDGENIENFGVSSGQDYIDNEIADMPEATFSNIISVSMVNFKSFLKMSPADRKKIIDRAFDLEIVNYAFDAIKADMKTIGTNINSANASMYALNNTITTTNNEIAKLQKQVLSAETQKKIDENLQVINESQTKLAKVNELYTSVNNEVISISNDITKLNNDRMKVSFEINQVQQKINLFAQDKCPTCGTSFSSAAFLKIKEQLVELKDRDVANQKVLDEKIAGFNTQQNEKRKYLNEIVNASNSLTQNINKLTSDNRVYAEQMKNSGEYQSLVNVINKTNEQIEIVKKSLEEYNAKLTDLTNLSVAYSIDGVKQLVINNYLPLLNQEISANLDLVDFPYQLVFDSKFEPTLTDMGQVISPDTLSFGEMSRVDLIVLCSLFKLIKRKYPTINILFIDEVISSLDPETSGDVLKFLKTFSDDNNLYMTIVSHTDLCLDSFDEIISVKKNIFSNFEIITPGL